MTTQMLLHTLEKAERIQSSGHKCSKKKRNACKGCLSQADLQALQDTKEYLYRIIQQQPSYSSSTITKHTLLRMADDLDALANTLENVDLRPQATQTVAPKEQMSDYRPVSIANSEFDEMLAARREDEKRLDNILKLAGKSTRQHAKQPDRSFPQSVAVSAVSTANCWDDVQSELLSSSASSVSSEEEQYSQYDDIDRRTEILESISGILERCDHRLS
mmetsp:Transcript_13883/g.22659  ORF Transcript_13883/g.22659 Transcript_13883/m.22659 type:complete len:218 (+) Transcript_13883:2-655(+)